MATQYGICRECGRRIKKVGLVTWIHVDGPQDHTARPKVEL